VSTSSVYFEAYPQFLPLSLAPEGMSWYAVHIKPRHEKRIAEQFEEKRVQTFLPLLRQIHKWSDRNTTVEVPMFSCYAFVHVGQTNEERLKVLRTPGVFGFVGNERQGTPIPQEQIENLQVAIRGNVPCFPHAFLNVGRRVRIRGGALNGVEGILERHGKDQNLVISVELLQRSMSIRVEGYDIEPV
jgi:transcription antitermination factor NusG